MRKLPKDSIKALSFLLEEWTTSAFTTEKLDVPLLNGMWITLAEALSGSHSLTLDQFQDEIALLRPTSRAGYPPIKSLERRLYELIDTGLREFFLVIAVRQAMEQLISLYFPFALDQWLQIAEEILPLKMQFAFNTNNV